MRKEKISFIDVAMGNAEKEVELLISNCSDDLAHAELTLITLRILDVFIRIFWYMGNERMVALHEKAMLRLRTLGGYDDEPDKKG